MSPLYELKLYKFAVELWGNGIKCFYSCDQRLCKFFGTKERVDLKKKFNSHAKDWFGTPIWLTWRHAPYRRKQMKLHEPQMNRNGRREMMKFDVRWCLMCFKNKYVLMRKVLLTRQSINRVGKVLSRAKFFERSALLKTVIHAVVWEAQLIVGILWVQTTPTFS